jgi:hypothetical protein
MDIATWPEPTAHVPPWTAFAGTLHLTSDRADRFVRDLAALVDSYRSQEGGGINVIVHAGAIRAPGRSTRRVVNRPRDR